MKDQKTWADRIISFNQTLDFPGRLPEGIEIMNPFRNNPEAVAASGFFYHKYYNDQKPRHLILGINPGRLGAGYTGIPFTDTNRLVSVCGIPWRGKSSHEPSSVFVYEMIEAYGGAELFYRDFFISSVSPLGFVKQVNGKLLNYNYYDHPDLKRDIRSWAAEMLRQQLNFGIKNDVVFCFGTGKNKTYIEELNRDFGFFAEVVALEHPRYIMQYKSATKTDYIGHYLQTFQKYRS